MGKNETPKKGVRVEKNKFFLLFFLCCVRSLFPFFSTHTCGTAQKEGIQNDESVLSLFKLKKRKY